MDVQVVKAGTETLVTVISGVNSKTTVLDVKKEIQKTTPGLYPERQALKSNNDGGYLDDQDVVLTSLREQNRLILKDLGPQVGYKTVFIMEYMGPLLIYIFESYRPALIYGQSASVVPFSYAASMALGCWCFHYVKRILETLFVHKFSRSTMPLRNLFKNCCYYWVFGALIGYYVDHPLYTPPAFGNTQVNVAAVVFFISELGNYSIHKALSDLRPPGSKERRLPGPTSNPFTLLFGLVACPNYTYEVMAWISFTVMTQSLAAAVFTAIGSYQMTIWALKKWRFYMEEFEDFPPRRKAIIPFIL